jgi:hypothetical protein
MCNRAPEDGDESTRWEFDFADASFRRGRMIFNVQSASTECSATTVGPQPDEGRFYFSDNPASNKRSNTVYESVNAIRTRSVPTGTAGAFDAAPLTQRFRGNSH